MKTIFFILAFISVLNAKPLWIDNPFVDGYIVGVGSSNNKNPMFKKRIAMAIARANLSEAIKVEIKTSMKITTKKANSLNTQVSEQTIQQKASALLVGSEIDDTYEDTDGTYFVLVILNKKDPL